MKKGEYGYIGSRRTRQALFLLAVIICALLIFVLGLFLNKMSSQNIFSVLAALFILPGAHFLTQFILLLPYSSPDRGQWEELQEMAEEGMTLLSDLVITSSERVMNLDFVVVTDNKVIALISKKKQDLPHLKEYFTKGIHNWGNGYQVILREDYESFRKDVRLIAKKQAEAGEKREDKNKKAVLDYILSLIV